MLIGFLHLPPPPFFSSSSTNNNNNTNTNTNNNNTNNNNNTTFIDTFNHYNNNTTFIDTINTTFIDTFNQYNHNHNQLQSIQSQSQSIAINTITITINHDQQTINDTIQHAKVAVSTPHATLKQHLSHQHVIACWTVVVINDEHLASVYHCPLATGACTEVYYCRVQEIILYYYYTITILYYYYTVTTTIPITTTINNRPRARRPVRGTRVQHSVVTIHCYNKS